MQKFKVIPLEIIKAYKELMSAPTMASYVLEGELLEGELLEGGTSEKCCESCFQYNAAYNKGFCVNPSCVGCHKVEKCKGNCPNVCKQHMGEFTFCSNLGCLCHNKKEEKVNPEDLKKAKFEVKIDVSPRIDYCCECDDYHGYDCPKGFNRETPKEEVKIPEKINVTFPLSELGETLCLQELVIKFNELRGYLASKENKGDK